MKIIFFGTPKEVIPVLDNLAKHFDVVAVVTTPDQKAGRKQLLTPTPIKTFAEKQNIQVIDPQQFNNSTIQQLENFNPDLFVVAAYGKLVPNEILDIPKYGAINIHPSLLPQYRGPTPIQTALLNGDETSGVTFIKMDAALDHGPILHQIPFTLEKTDTFDWLMHSMFAQAAQVLSHMIENYVSGKITPQTQDESQATFTKRITKEDGFIVLDKPPAPEHLDRMIRAYYPWPTVWTKIVIARKNDEAISPTKILKLLPKHMLQLEGKNPVSLKDFLNGYPEMRDTITKLFS